MSARPSIDAWLIELRVSGRPLIRIDVDTDGIRQQSLDQIDEHFLDVNERPRTPRIGVQVALADDERCPTNRSGLERLRGRVPARRSTRDGSHGGQASSTGWAPGVPAVISHSLAVSTAAFSSNGSATAR